MDTSKKVQITSKVNARVVMTVPYLNLYKEWGKKGTVVSIPFDLLQEAYFDTGVEELFKQGLLYINDMEVKKELGLEPEDATEPVNIIDITDDLLKRALGPMPLDEFKTWFSKLQLEQKRDVARYAVQNRILDYSKSKVIKDDIQIDIIKAVELDTKNEEAPPKE